MTIFVSLLLAALVLITVSIQRAYAHLPIRELKRRAREHDKTAELLYRASAYGASLRFILWIIIGLSATVFITYVTKNMPLGLAILASLILIWLSFGRTPREINRFSLWLAAEIAPFLSWILRYLDPILSRFINFIHKHRPVQVHTGLYDKSDFLDLINDQNVQADNRIEEYELELAFHALTFGDKLVADHLTPRRIVKTVSVNDTIGPVLMDELHASGHSRFPVYEGSKDNIIGTLYLRDLIKTKSTGKVKDIMRREVAYVHEDQNLYDALRAVLKTRHHLLVVVNSFEEYVGVISIEDVLEQILGRTIVDEFDQYDDLRAVAERAAKKEHKEHKEEPATVTTDDEVVE